MSTRLSNDIINGLARVGAERGATLFITALTAFKILLMRYSGRTDVVVTSSLAHRTEPQTESLIGYFATAILLRTKLADDISFDEALERVRSVCMDAHEHQEIPLGKLVEWLPGQDFSLTPAYRVHFGLQQVPAKRKGFVGVETRPFAITGAGTFGDRGAVSTLCDLRWQLWKDEGGYTLVVVYRSGFCDRSLVDKMVSDYISVMAAVIADTRRPIWRRSPSSGDTC